MPCEPFVARHRRKLGPRSRPFNACVARPVGKAEIARAAAAQEAEAKEWKRLRDKYVWGEDNPREWADVVKEAKSRG
eukprot:14597764-Alexandrium_andersonii.AAC.1